MHRPEPPQATPVTAPENCIDAVAVLKNGHREISEWFEEYDAAPSNLQKQEVASRICGALQIQLAIEEEVFHPAFRDAVGTPVSYDLAIVDHINARRLIDQILASSPIDEHFDSKVRILGDAIAQWLKDEDGEHGIFAQAQDSDLDLESLGQRMLARKRQLENQHNG
jgi:hypothetical protein